MHIGRNTVGIKGDFCSRLQILFPLAHHTLIPFFEFTMPDCFFQDILENNKFQFKHYVAPYLQDAPILPLQVKLEHTQYVLDHALHLIDRYLWAEDVKLSVALAALYHDIGRFEQYKRWQTFSDAHSGNHALLGVCTMKKQGFLMDVPKHVRSWVLAAIGMHNRAVLPQNLSSELHCIVNAVRDADKLDILRVIAEYFRAEHSQAGAPNDSLVLHVRNEPDVWTKDVAERLCRGEIIPYSALRTVNDFRLLLVSWIHSFSFPEIREQYTQSSYLKEVLEGLPKTSALDEVWEYIYGIIEQVDLNKQDQTQVSK